MTSRTADEEVKGVDDFGEEDDLMFGPELSQFADGSAEPLVRDRTPARQLALVVFASACCGLTATTLGYDVGIMSCAIVLIKEELALSELKEEVVVGALNFVAALGALVAAQTADALGRRATILACCALYVVGTLLMALARGFWVLLLGRAVTGLGVGVSFVVTPVYIAEITPARLRGALGAVFDVSINVGIVLGYVVGFAVETRVSRANVAWRLMLGLGLVLPCVVLLTLPALPESPRWLVARGARADALRVLRAISADEAEARATADAIAAGLARDREAPVTWRELLVTGGPALRRLATLVTLFGVWQQATGSEAILYYSPTFLEVGGWGGWGERRARDPAPTARARLV